MQPGVGATQQPPKSRGVSDVARVEETKISAGFVPESLASAQKECLPNANLEWERNARSILMQISSDLTLLFFMAQTPRASKIA